MRNARVKGAAIRLVTSRVLVWAAVVLVGTAAAGCARQPAANTGGPAPASQQGGSTQALPPGFSVSCAAGQRAVVQQVLNGTQPMTDVRCVADVMQAGPAPAGGAPGLAAGGVAAAPQLPGQAVGGPASGFAAADRWPAPASPPPARTVAYRTDGDVLTYEPRRRVRVNGGRSWQKSAIVIGSSAGIGAGVGAAIGGKKGALIGAAIGGGSATIWDQATRRR